MNPRKFVILLCLIVPTCPFALAGKKQDAPRILPEPKPDQALVYVCQIPPPLMAFGTTPIFLDDTLLGGGVGPKACTYDYVEPGTHVIWHSASKLVGLLSLGFFEWHFKPGETYYLGLAGWDGVSFHLQDDTVGKRRVAKTKKLTVEATPQHEEILQYTFYKYHGGMLATLDTANNPLIALSRLDQANEKSRLAETGRRETAVQDYTQAMQLYAEAANKFDELARMIARKRNNPFLFLESSPPLVLWGIPFYQQNKVDSWEEFYELLERCASNAKRGQAETQRRIACYAASEDATIVDGCIGEANGR